MPRMQAGIDDDEPETFPCYRHPDRETALRCNSCERPVCVDCAVQGAVGIKCPDCARTSRAARGVVPAHRLARGVIAGALVAIVAGTLLFYVDVPFLGIILAYLAGLGVGEVSRRASGGYRDPMLARAAAVSAGVGMLALPVALLVSRGGGSAQFLVWSLIAAAAAAYGAWNRAS